MYVVVVLKVMNFKAIFAIGHQEYRFVGFSDLWLFVVVSLIC
jgi:hypothetical protein